MGGELYQDPASPPPLAPETRMLVAKHFAAADHERVLAALTTYGARWFEREHDRVRRAIIALAHGSADELETLVGYARRDYRDVLMWAEYQKDPATGRPAVEGL